jgi:hypothetical protein
MDCGRQGLPRNGNAVVAARVLMTEPFVVAGWEVSVGGLPTVRQTVGNASAVDGASVEPDCLGEINSRSARSGRDGRATRCESADGPLKSGAHM